MVENKNNPINGWTEYGKLVLAELKRLHEGQEKLRTDMDKQFNDINETLTNFKSTEKKVEEIKEWKEKVTEVWSTSQMKQSKDEIYEQKNQWQKVTGVLIAIQVLIGIALAFAKKLF